MLAFTELTNGPTDVAMSLTRLQFTAPETLTTPHPVALTPLLVVPAPHDHWRDMQFEHDDMDPEEAGISADEKARRTKYLNDVWWPQITQQVEEEHQRLKREHGETFIERWHHLVDQPPDVQHGVGIV